MIEGLQLAFVADDFGRDAGVNEAILLAHRHGALTGASLMMGQPGTLEAIALARSNPGLDLGWHLHLCDSNPLTLPAWPWGDSPVRAGFTLALTPMQRRRIRHEIEHQWRAFQETGLPCRFINSHHHLHLHPWVWRVIRETVGDAGGAWFRGGAYRSFGPGGNLASRLTLRIGNLRSRALASGPFRTPATVWGLDRVFQMNAGEIQRVIPTLPPGLHEFMFHPRTPTNDPEVQALHECVGMLNAPGRSRF
ncbi:MAG: ChbG/HpnK family deacetylase [Verrucomicrobiales bacterium]|nr:ChbG/HpnK family deacetylase [Verrucomicrobiales bacterium]